MSIVHNLLKHRAVKVRDGNGVVITIPVGGSADVKGFKAERKFNAALIEAGEIRVGGGRGDRRQDNEERQAQLKADLDAAQTAFKNAKDKLIEANKVLKDDDSDANKKAKSVAADAYKVAERELDAAQRAFEKG